MKFVALGLAVLVVAPVLALAGIEGPVAPAPDLLDPSELAASVLASPNIKLRPLARADVEAGRVDPRVLAMLLAVSQYHSLEWVGPFVSGHSYFVAGTNRASNHVYGRAVDISMVDGRRVSRMNGDALELVSLIATIPPPLRPSELGAPWKLRIGDLVTFVQNHEHHVHVGYGLKDPL